MERPARVARQPLAHGGMLVGGVVVDDRVDRLSGRNLALDDVEKADELLMPMTLHVAADHGSVEHVHRRKQGRRPVSLVVVGHGSGAALLERQPGLRSVERLDLALFVDAEHDSVRRRIDVEPDDVAQLADEVRVTGQLELPDPMRLEPMGAPDALHGTDADTRRLGHRRACPMRRFVRRLLHRQRDDALRDGGIELRDARGSRLVVQKPFPPSAAKRSCQRQTQVLDLPVSRMIAFVPSPSALSNTICARHTCFWGALRSLTKAWSRSRSARVTEMETSVRMPQTRMAQVSKESQSGFKCQT